MSWFRRKQDNSNYVFGVFVIAVALILVFFVHVTVQQNYRQNANDPQIQIVEDAAMALEAGQAPKDLVKVTSVDPSKSLSNFLVITDADGKILASDMKIGSETPIPPSGVLATAKKYGQNRLTWQPQTNTRIALIVEHYQNDKQAGYVLAGRSLREVEAREYKLSLMSVMVGTLIVLSGLTALLFSGRKI